MQSLKSEIDCSPSEPLAGPPPLVAESLRLELLQPLLQREDLVQGGGGEGRGR